jgi:ABC-2 type transport system permease protein
MIYWEIVKFRFARFLTYPYEIVAALIERGLEITFLIIFWTLVTKGSDANNQIELISYFFISMGIGDLVMARWEFLGKYLADQIKTGRISIFLVKPVNIIFSYYASSLGLNGIKMALAIIFIFVGIIIYPPQSALAVGLFMFFLFWAVIITFAYNLMVATMYFHLTEASGLKNSISHMVRFFDGRFAPLYLFPTTLRSIAVLLPFSAMVYGPTVALNTNSITGEVLKNMGVAAFWGVVFPIIGFVFWKTSIKKYEAVGI